MAVIDEAVKREAGTAAYEAAHALFDREDAAARPWLRALRHRALARFVGLGFPTTRDEEWRFTNVAPIAGTAFRVAAAGPALDKGALAPFGVPPLDATTIVFVNGRFAPHLSSPGEAVAGLAVRSLAAMPSADADRLEAHVGRHAEIGNQPFVALNTAFLADAAFIEVAPHAAVERPVHVVFLSAPASEPAATFHSARLLVHAGRDSQLRLVESYATWPGHPGARAFTNAVTQFAIDDGAVVDHYRIQSEAPSDYHVSATDVQLSRSSTFRSHAFTLGGGLVRNDVNARLGGEGGDCTVNGLYLADGERLIDNHTFIDHAAPHCGSHEVYKGIIGGHARAVFNGKILVRPDAQKTDAKQTNKTLLLSDDAQINTKPQLEIYANDVKCTHGATVGQLSADALFYLRARGIGLEDARRMLIRAFAADITSRVTLDALRGQLEAVLDGRAAGPLEMEGRG